eukprot:2763777-Pyramimonas_sp.AAC.1
MASGMRVISCVDPNLPPWRRSETRYAFMTGPVSCKVTKFITVLVGHVFVSRRMGDLLPSYRAK